MIDRNPRASQKVRGLSMPGFLCYSQRMASIQVSNGTVTVTLTEPDEDGLYDWTCTCGSTSDYYQVIGDSIAEAEIHVDIYHQRETGH